MVSIIIAIVAIALLCGGALLLIMVATDRSAVRSPSHRASLGSIGIGVALLLFASVIFAHTYSRARTGEPMHFKHGVFTPAQGYLVSGGCLVAGAVMIIAAFRGRRP
jgi:hypothetical protein